MDAKILSARMVTRIDTNPEIMSDSPETIEITTEKVVTETRTYEKEFLLKDRAQITQDKIDYAAARDAELEDIETLLMQFDRLAIKEVISAKI